MSKTTEQLLTGSQTLLDPATTGTGTEESKENLTRTSEEIVSEAREADGESAESGKESAGAGESVKETEEKQPVQATGDASGSPLAEKPKRGRPSKKNVAEKDAVAESAKKDTTEDVKKGAGKKGTGKRGTKKAVEAENVQIADGENAFTKATRKGASKKAAKANLQVPKNEADELGLNDDSNFDYLMAMMAKSKKVKLTLAEMTELLQCECIETTRTYTMILKGDTPEESAKMPIISVPKEVFVDAKDKPLSPFVFHKMHDLMATINLPVPEDSTSLFVRMEMDAVLFAKPKVRLVVTSPRNATHMLHKFGSGKRLHEGSNFYKGSLMEDVWNTDDELVHFTWREFEYLVAPIGYVNMHIDIIDGEYYALAKSNTYSERNLKYIRYAEGLYAKALNAIYDAKLLREREAQLKVEQQRTLEAQMPQLMVRAESIVERINNVVASEPDLASLVPVSEATIDPFHKTVVYLGMTYQINGDSLSDLEKKFYAAKDKLEDLKQRRRVANIYRSELIKGKYPVYFYSYYGAPGVARAVHSIVDEMPRGIGLNAFRPRVLVRCNKDNIEIVWVTLHKKYDLNHYTVDRFVETYTYDGPNGLEYFIQKMDELMDTWTYRRHYEKLRTTKL